MAAIGSNVFKRLVAKGDTLLFLLILLSELYKMGLSLHNRHRIWLFSAPQTIAH